MSNNEKVREMFSIAVTDALTRWPSLRAAQNATGIHYSTLQRMKDGMPVEVEIIVKFARAIAPTGEEVVTALRFLELAGKDDMVSLLLAVEKEAKAQLKEGSGQTVISPDVGEVVVLAVGDRPGVEFEATSENLEMLAAVVKAAGIVKQPNK